MGMRPWVARGACAKDIRRGSQVETGPSQKGHARRVRTPSPLPLGLSVPHGLWEKSVIQFVLCRHPCHSGKRLWEIKSERPLIQTDFLGAEVSKVWLLLRLTQLSPSKTKPTLLHLQRGDSVSARKSYRASRLDQAVPRPGALGQNPPPE